MALDSVVEKIDALPEHIRGFYVEKDGKFHLDLLKIDIEDTSGLKNALKAERDRAAKHEKTAKQYAGLGKTAEEIHAMVDAAAAKEQDAALKAGKFDEVLATHLGKAKEERDAAVGVASKRADSALGIARRAIVNSNIGDALVKAKATTEGLDLLKDRLGGRVKIEFGDDGAEAISIMESDGKTPMVGSGKGGLATFEDLVKEATKAYPSLFEGTGAGGGGKGPNNRQAGSKTITRADFDTMGPIERSTKIKEGFTVVD